MQKYKMFFFTFWRFSKTIMQLNASFEQVWIIKAYKNEMKHTGPKMTYFNQPEEDLEKTWLGETIEPKDFTRFTKEQVTNWHHKTHHRV